MGTAPARRGSVHGHHGHLDHWCGTRLGTKPLIGAGLAFLTIGLVLLAGIHPDGSFVVDVLPGSLVSAIGMSLAFIPATMSAIGGAAPRQAGLASGVVNTTYQIGSAFGLAAMTALATANGAGQLGNPPALTDGFSAAFVGAAVLAGLAALLAILTLRRPKPAPDPERVGERVTV